MRFPLFASYPLSLLLSVVIYGCSPAHSGIAPSDQASLETIVVTPNPAKSITVGQREQFTATGHYSDGSTANLTGAATWNSSNKIFATISTDGSAAGVAPGSTTITASLNGIVSPGVSLGVTVATPTLVQNTVCTAVASESGVPMFAGTTYGCGFPSETQAQNALICTVKWNVTGNYTVQISDDQDNPYNLAIDMVNDGNEYVSVYYALGVAPGTKMITFTFSGGPPSDTQADCSEFYDVTTVASGALDAISWNSSAGAGGTSLTAGSFTTTASNDVIWNWAINDGINDNALDVWTAGAGFILAGADDAAYSAVQYQVSGGAGTINPEMGQSLSTDWMSVAIALKSGAAGSAPPPGIYVQETTINPLNNIPLTNHQFSLQFPCSGNLLVVGVIAQNGDDVAAITDSAGNNWTQAGSVFSAGAAGDLQTWYAAGASCPSNVGSSGLMLTFTMVGGLSYVSLDSYEFYDISGAAAAPFEGRGTAGAGQATGGDIVIPSLLTPSSPNGVAIIQTGVQSQTILGITGPSGAAYNPPDQNNGWADYYNADTTPISVTWHTNGGVLNGWGATAVAFQATR